MLKVKADPAAYPTITLGRLRQELAGLADDFELSFSGLEFLRVKQRAPKLLQIEFTQTVYRTAEGHVVVDNH